MIKQNRLAQAACTLCRLNKRRCDKKLPACSLCVRKDWICIYTPRASRRPSLRQHRTPQSLPGREDFLPPNEADISVAASAASPPVQRNTFPAVAFLDWEIYSEFNIAIPTSSFSVPPYVSQLVGNRFKAQEIMSVYFSTIHTWMPVVPRKIFESRLSDETYDPPPDYILLLLCMNLITLQPLAGDMIPDTQVYFAAKRFHLDLELAGALSIQVLQAQILISLYEIGHGIYPSAFTSVGGCARYGQALGIDWRSKVPMSKAFSWVEAEERNRAWWAVVLLDLAVNIGYPGRLDLIQDLDSDTVLPSDDLSWDRGIIPSKAPLSVSAPSSDSMGRFALIAQATYLFGRVMRHINFQSIDPCIHSEESILLDGTLRALLSVVNIEWESNQVSFMNQTAICSIALVLLHEAHSGPSNDEFSPGFDESHYARVVNMKITQAQAPELQNDNPNGLHACVEDASPFISPLLYHSILTMLRFHHSKEGGTGESQRAVERLKYALQRFDDRWKSAGAYLKILEAREMKYLGI